jgi:acetyl-CoA carboxylase biotin carboxylase subunit
MTKTKILCLHGLGTNAIIMYDQMKTIIDNNSWYIHDETISNNMYINPNAKLEFHFINSPNEINQDEYYLVDKEVQHYYKNHKYYYWYNFINCNYNKKKKLYKKYFIKSLEYLKKNNIQDYDIVIGFSQGAVIASLCVQNNLMTNAVMICSPYCLQKKYYEKFNNDHNILHVIGSKDTINKSSLLNILSNDSIDVYNIMNKLYEGCHQKSIFDGGHVIPRINKLAPHEQKSANDIIEFINNIKTPIKKILIVNRGMSALKFIHSFNNQTINKKPKLYGFATPNDLKSGFTYLKYLDNIIKEDDDIYMNINKIIETCKKYNIDAVFPGWGYLSERSDFVEELEKNNIIFMGPSAYTINQLGNKINSMIIAQKLNVPLLEWSGENPLNTLNLAKEAIKRISLPAIMKHADGGGGKGIRIINNINEVENAYNEVYKEMNCSKETASIFIMGLATNCRHVEIQLLGDGDDVIHLYGRDCTLQRRNQKLIEEGPIIVLNDRDKKIIEDSAVKLAKAVKYKGFGTAEFLYEPDTSRITFLEINTRIQVEHVVSELLTGINIPYTLYLISSGYKLKDIIKNDITTNGHVITARICAENPFNNFSPSNGKINSIFLPSIPNTWGYTSLVQGNIVNNIDSQFGHVFAWGKNRIEAIDRMIEYLDKMKIVSDVYHTGSFLKLILKNDKFRNNKYHTQWLHSNLVNQFNTNEIDDLNFIGAIVLGYKKWTIINNEFNDLIKRGHKPVKINKINLKIPSINNSYEVNSYNFINLNINNSKFRISSNNACVDFEIYQTDKLSKFNIVIMDKIFDIDLIHLDDSRLKFILNDKFIEFVYMVDPRYIIATTSGKITNIYNGEKNNSWYEMEAMKMIIKIPIVGKNVKLTVQIGQNIREGDQIGTKDPENKNEIINKNIDFPNWIKSFPEETIQISKPIKITKTDENRETKYNMLNTSSIEKFISYFNADKIKQLNYKNNEVIKIKYSENNLLANKSSIMGFKLTKSGFRFVVIINDILNERGSFGKDDCIKFQKYSEYARNRKYPRLFIVASSGAKLDYHYNSDIYKLLRFDSSDKIFYINKEIYKKNNLIDEFEIDEYSKTEYKIKRIKNYGPTNLDGAALMAKETVLSYNDGFTLTYVTGDYAVGIGAYLCRLGHRLIQKKSSSLLLTGNRALNKLLGKELYGSNIEIGGPEIMGSNGVSHMIVDTDEEAVNNMLYWTELYSSKTKKVTDIFVKPSNNTYIFQNILDKVIDNNTWMETMKDYGKTIISGRARINKKAYGIIYSSSNNCEKIIPVDPGNLLSSSTTEIQVSSVLFPDSSYKMAQTINDVNREGLPLLMLMNARGFSGGTRDMYNEILKFGSMIVENLTYFKQNIYIYVLPDSQIRGGSMVVMSKAINPNIRFICDPSSNVNILEPDAGYEIIMANKLKDFTKDQIMALCKLHDNVSDEVIGIDGNPLFEIIKLDDLRHIL